jgi:hypothetical protein
MIYQLTANVDDAALTSALANRKSALFRAIQSFAIWISFRLLTYLRSISQMRRWLHGAIDLCIREFRIAS